MPPDVWTSELKQATRNLRNCASFVIHCSRELRAIFINPPTPPPVDIKAQADNLFLVSSTIHPCDQPLSYGDTRTAFSHEERFEQTLTTVGSVRRYCPGAQVILLENSTLSVDEARKLESVCDAVIRFDQDPSACALRDCPFKGAGEAYMLLAAFQGISDQGFRRCFKLSGRYALNSSFSLNSYSVTNFGFSTGPGPTYSTRLFCVPSARALTFVVALQSSLRRALANISIEKALYLTVPREQVDNVVRLGVQGMTGVSAQSIAE